MVHYIFHIKCIEWQSHKQKWFDLNDYNMRIAETSLFLHSEIELLFMQLNKLKNKNNERNKVTLKIETNQYRVE